MAGSLVEPGRHKIREKGNLLEDLTEDKEGERRLEEEEEFFDENEEAVKAPSQLGEDKDAFGRQVGGMTLLQENFIDIIFNRFLATLATELPRKVHRA